MEVEITTIEVNGVDKLILLDGYLSYDPESCFCCSDCCLSILGGSFDGVGDLLYSNTYQDLKIILPTKFVRTICHGDKIEVRSRVKPAYAQDTNKWHVWHERDWLYESHGASGPDLEEGGHCRIWETSEDETFINLKFTSCFVDYVKQYGEIVFGPMTGNAPGEMIQILCEDLEIPAGTDCCPYDIECSPCRWYFSDLGDPVGPELTEEGITYWLDDSSGWSLKVILGGVDTQTKTIGRGEAVDVEAKIRWDKFEYENYLDWAVDFCWTHINWKGGSGDQFHPQFPGLPELQPSVECYPSDFSSISPDECHNIDRTYPISPAMIYMLGAAIAICFDEDCGNELEPESPIVKASIVSELPVINLELELLMPDCPNTSQIECCDCEFAALYEFQVLLDDEPETPPPEMTTWFFGYERQVVQIGVSIEDCTTHSGVYVLTYFIAMCNTIDFQSQVAAEICEAMTAQFGEACVSNLFGGGPISFVTAKSSVQQVCDQAYDNPPEPGNCDSMIYCEIKETVDAVCCGGPG